MFFVTTIRSKIMHSNNTTRGTSIGTTTLKETTHVNTTKLEEATSNEGFCAQIKIKFLSPKGVQVLTQRP
jgi:hypothetical protein